MRGKNPWTLPNLSAKRCRIHGKVSSTNPLRNTSSSSFFHFIATGGNGLTMAAVRERYWVPRLRSLVKLVRKKCWGCKRFQQRAFTPPVAGQLPDDRTTSGTAFEVIGVDFAGPIKFRRSNKAEAKAYLCIFARSLSRAIHLELCAIWRQVLLSCA